MTRNKILELLRSGNFTIAYHDNQCCLLYKGHHEYDNLPSKEIEMPLFGEGYTPPEVELLVEALKGKVVSI